VSGTGTRATGAKITGSVGGGAEELGFTESGREGGGRVRVGDGSGRWTTEGEGVAGYTTIRASTRLSWCEQVVPCWPTCLAFGPSMACSTRPC
jgi:hypothetical protein